jgi:hypothetical protein
VNTSGAQANGYSGFAAISADGRYVAFNSNASNLVDGDTNGAWDVFVRDRTLGSTMRASVSTDGTQGNNTPSLDPGLFPSISAEGRFVAFSSKATNLVRRDTNGSEDVFLRDRTEGPFRSLCGPGIDGVIPCPCANPPSGGDRGCDNSAGTGGAVLSAGGRASVSSDSLVFTTGGEKPAEASVLVQGDALVASGVVYGQGVRCAGGSLKRLYTTTAFDDGIFAPDWSAGDAPVSIRSAALGSPILPGESRWYFVSYRDPIVLGGCPPASTFNSTQTVIASWSP